MDWRVVLVVMQGCGPGTDTPTDCKGMMVKARHIYLPYCYISTSASSLLSFLYYSFLSFPLYFPSKAVNYLL